MILGLHFENTRPDIHVGGVGLFHHLWLDIQLATNKRMLKWDSEVKAVVTKELGSYM